jgi:hypothetical protein
VSLRWVSKPDHPGDQVQTSPVAASLLSKPCGTKAVKPGLLVGIAKIVV